MKLKVLFSFMIIIVLSLLLFSCKEYEPYDGLEIHCINVGQGDCTLIIAPNGKCLMVDGGEKGSGRELAVPYIRSLGIDSIQYAIGTHFHSDHMGAIDEIMNKIPITRYMYDRGGSVDKQFYYEYLRAVKNVPARRKWIKKGEYIDLDSNIVVKCVSSAGNNLVDDDFNENDMSVAVVVSYGDFDFFVGGDLSGERYLRFNYHDIESSVAKEVGQIEVLRINHHGSDHSSNATFLSTLDPLVGVLSSGKNGYGHPRQAVLDRLDSLYIDVYQTENGDGSRKDGDIVIRTDGNTFTVHTRYSGSMEYAVYE